MAGGEESLVTPVLLLDLVRQICAVGISGAGDKNKNSNVFRKDCMDLVRRVSLLTHFLEEISGQLGSLNALGSCSSSSKEIKWSSDLVAALQSAKNLLSLAGPSQSTNNSDGAVKKIVTLFHSVTWEMEKSLANIPYDQFDISEEVQEQVVLVRAQLRRATERYSSKNSREISFAFAQPIDKDVDQSPIGNRLTRTWHIENSGCVNNKAAENTQAAVSGSDGSKDHSAYQVANELNVVDGGEKDSLGNKSGEDLKKPDTLKIPDDFLCPISLELMRDPVIVATGQTYERSYMQRWIDTGNSTCPKTQQKLEHFTLTPNYVLRSLITQWCAEHKVEQPPGLANGRIKKSDGSFCDVSGDIAPIQAIVRKLSSRSIEERRAAISEVRSLSKRSTDNRILIAEAGAIPVLVNLLTSEDMSIITALLTMLTDSRNCMVDEALTILSVLASNQEAKVAIVKASTIPVLIDLLRTGLPRNKENAAAILLSLCKRDPENLACISRLGAVIPLTELSKNGTERAKRKATSMLEHLRRLQQN
ncbi:U BOX DOMAIN-CONTAINING [Salix purpurea]|uniref:RING-type E3 ubiquitin transferase n=1 Tax=Salix purpurea TaxID=77065 RepID=A0A9Q0Z2E9_SALPP|nr:U BOX DOMAIN-CONTAINING [Salix purpurea]